MVACGRRRRRLVRAQPDELEVMLADAVLSVYLSNGLVLRWKEQGQRISSGSDDAIRGRTIIVTR